MINPFFSASTLPYELPPFADISDDDFAPAFERGMAEQLAEIDAITGNPDAPSFDNTLVPLERSGRILSRAAFTFFNLTSADTNDVRDAIQAEWAPRFAAHADAIQLNSRLFARIAAVRQGADEEAEKLEAEQRHLVERYFIEMKLAGAGLTDQEKARLSELNARISTLTTAFDTELLADTNDLALIVDDAAELDGLSAGEISAAALTASERGMDGKYVISLVLPTAHPYQESLANRETRRRLYEAQRARGSRGGEHDTRGIALELVRLRAERAELLGFANHAAAVTADNTAGTPAKVMELLTRLAGPAARNARREQESLERQAGFAIQPWDWPFYAERVRAAEFDVDTAALRDYFEAERVLRDGVFFAATRLFGITFTERADLAGYHPDVRVFEVAEEDGTPVGLYLLDIYTRDSKRGGAWMNSLVDQSELLGMPTAIVVNNLNVPKPGPGEPTLLSYDEVTTLFHEFGHALHGLLARVTYPKFAGTAVFRDFVEYPSQVNEMWMLWPEVIANYARHHATGRLLDSAVIERLEQAGAFNEGFATSEYLAAALLDQAWHQLKPAEAAEFTDPEQAAGFEENALAEVGLDLPAVPSRYYTGYFAHLFAGGYGAAYYSYIWSEVLDADTVEWFKANGGLTRANGEEYRTNVIGFGGARDPLVAYRAWRGRDAEIEPLLRRRGLE